MKPWRITKSTAALALVALAGSPAMAATVRSFDLPRSGESTAVRAAMECLDDKGCKLGLKCGEPDARGAIDSDDPDHYNRDKADFGELLWTEWEADAGRACEVEVEGRTNVSVIREDRVQADGEWTPTGRQTSGKWRDGSVIGQFGGTDEDSPYTVADGWGACRPAREGRPCPDARHIRRTCRDSVGYAVIGGGHGVRPDQPQYPVQTWIYAGDSLELSSRLYDVAGQAETGHTTAWFASHGLVEGSLDPNDEAVFRAPQDGRRQGVVVTATVYYGDTPRYCATTSVEIIVFPRPQSPPR
ncbi:MAG: hypothetical protein OXU77_01465 [Gammaproteobacteria bacterium]|nr:hypothetical protein [Gammaproteobacteria bacterium]MDE0440516.1 hypothetical protein [Gammaproteobacteria bacterium]